MTPRQHLARVFHGRVAASRRGVRCAGRDPGGALLGEAYAGRDDRLALALPLLLGVGMALPWPFAGAGIAALPKPGAWMMRVKQVLGVVILANRGYYGYEAYGLFRTRSADPSVAASSVRTDGWYDSLSEGLAVARRDGKPVLIDMWATWCKNCVVMDQTTFKLFRP